MSPDPGQRSNVLLVDDDPINLHVLQAMLAKLPLVEVHTADSGFRALELGQDMEFAVAVLDVAMPAMSGLETAERLRATPANARTPIIFMSAAKVGRSDLFKGYEKGAVDYLLKPLDREVLLPKVATFVEMHQARHAAAASLHEAKQETREVSSLLAAARAVLTLEDFQASARRVFEAAKLAVGATAGYVALLSPGGQENEVLFLDAGGRPCSVDPSLPMPIRGLRAKAYAGKRAVMENHFPASPWAALLPQGHAVLDNVLFAPLLIGDEPQGVLGLANKPGGFSDQDLALAAAFGDLAAIALRNARNLDSLEDSRRNLLKAQTWARMGSFIVDMPSRRVEWTGGMYAVLGLQPASVTADDPFQALPEQARAPFEALLEQAMQAPGAVEMELDLDDDSGDRNHRSLLIQVEPERDDSGRLVRLLGTCLDQTRHKALTRQLLTTQRLEAVGQLAGGVAHEINTPIQYILTNLDFFDQACEVLKAFHAQVEETAQSPNPAGRDSALAERLRGILDRTDLKTYMSEVPAALSDVRQGLSKVSSIISAMRQLVPPVTDPHAPMDVSAMVRHLVTVTTGGIENPVQIRTELDPDLPPVIASQSEMSQAVLNVLMNAIQAAPRKPGKGLVTVRTRREGRYAVIEVEDNGPGIPEAIRGRVFDPFFTTKEPETATGQGLAITHFVVQRHGGVIDFTSRAGRGTTFYIRLPLVDASGTQGGTP